MLFLLFASLWQIALSDSTARIARDRDKVCPIFFLSFPHRAVDISWHELKADPPLQGKKGKGGQLIVFFQLNLGVVRIDRGPGFCNVQFSKIFFSHLEMVENHPH